MAELQPAPRRRNLMERVKIERVKIVRVKEISDSLLNMSDYV